MLFHDDISKKTYRRFLNILNKNNVYENENEEKETINIPKPSENCKNLIHFIFEESYQLSFDQFILFSSLSDLNLLKRALDYYDSEEIMLLNEDLFINFFVNFMPLENQLMNDSIFEIFTFLVEKYFKNDDSFQIIADKCINNIQNEYFYRIFVSICKKHPFPIFWSYIPIFKDQNIDLCFIIIRGLLSNGIIPETSNINRNELILFLLINIKPGVFSILKLLNLSNTEYQFYNFDDIIIQTLNYNDLQILSELFSFIEFYICNISDEIIINIFDQIEKADFKIKFSILKFFNSIIYKISILLINILISKGLLEVSCDFLFANSNEIKIVSLSIVQSIMKRSTDMSISHIIPYYDEIEQMGIDNHSMSGQVNWIIKTIKEYNSM